MMLHPLECETHTEMTKMTETRLEIFYRSREECRNNWYAEPALETLAETHIQLPYFVSDQLNFEVSDGLDYIFMAFNDHITNPLSVGHISGGHQEWMEEVGIGHTSMSVGDVVCINGTYLACARSGWTQLN